jgi:hypothetical protein
MSGGIWQGGSTGGDKSMNEDERTFINKFKKNFSKQFFNKGDSNLEVADHSSNSKFVDGNKIAEQQLKTHETLEDLKNRMSKLEEMFSKIFNQMENIGNEVKEIRLLQEKPVKDSFSSESQISESL